MFELKKKNMMYSGRRFLNFNTIITLFFFLPMVIYVSSEQNLAGSLFFLIPLICLLYIQEAFYFEINEKILIIRNIALPFLKIKYDINKIESVRISNSGFKTFSIAQLQIVSGNKKSLGFRSASLKKKDWQSLIQDLKDRQIKIDLKCNNLKLK